jgi:hypothetical protein
MFIIQGNNPNPRLAIRGTILIFYEQICCRNSLASGHGSIYRLHKTRKLEAVPQLFFIRLFVKQGDVSYILHTGCPPKKEDLGIGTVSLLIQV